MLVELAAAVLIAQAGPDTGLLALARQAIVANQIDSAIDLAQRYVSSKERDPEGYIVLGDAYARRFPAGRLAAINAYRRAEDLAPLDVRAFARESGAGLVLGGADGARIAREALEHVMELDPYFPGAWDNWLVLYRNAGGREGMIARLRRWRPASDTLRARIALLLMESEQYASANAVLDTILARRPDAPELLALRAQSAYESGDTTAGSRFYQLALAHAAADTAGALWQQVIGIATPSEITAWGTVRPGDRTRWLETFWARRNPDLFAGTNLRIAEHFARWRYARKAYPLQQPLLYYHRSALARSLNLEPSSTERALYMRCEATVGMGMAGGGVDIPLPGVTSARDRASMSMGVLNYLLPDEMERARSAASQAGRLGGFLPPIIQKAMAEDGPLAFTPTTFAPLGLDLRSVDSVAARIGYNLSTGLDDRGLMYLRFGRPEHLVIGTDNTDDQHCHTTELERWRYDQWGEVRFARPSAFSDGTRNVTEMVFRPMNVDQFDMMSRGLTQEASSVRSPLDFGVWTAQLADTGGTTDVAVVVTKGAVAAQLVGTSTWGDAIRSDSGVALVVTLPGRAVLLVNALDRGELGRQRQGIAVRSFAPGALAISDELLASSWGAAPRSREEMLRRVSRDLTFAKGSVVTTYVEVYGLAVADSVMRYSVRYSLLKTGAPARDIALPRWSGERVLDYERRVRGATGQRQLESIDLTADLIPSGTYLLRVNITDLVTGNGTTGSTIAFRVH